MRWTAVERRWRDALIASVIPAGPSLPALGDIELSEFWARFEETAPVHLRLGMRVSTVTIGALLPWLLGYFRTLPGLDDEQRDEVIERALRLPLAALLVDVTKMVACLAYFADPSVQQSARRKT